MWTWLWRVGPRMVNAFRHVAERYRGLAGRSRDAEAPIIRQHIELVELPSAQVPLPMARSQLPPTCNAPPVPSISRSPLPPLPSRSAGPNTLSSVWSDGEFDE
jgi:hypothetical protein